MKVRCVALVDGRGKPTETSPWLAVGNEYLVISIYLSSVKGDSFHLVLSEDGDRLELGIWPIGHFTIRLVILRHIEVTELMSGMTQSLTRYPSGSCATAN